MKKSTSNDRNFLANLVLYGNLDGKEIIAINADSMEVHSIIPLTNSEQPYAVDRIGLSDVLLTIARGYPVTERINIESLPEDYNLKHVCVQNLKHSPRTARGNTTGDKALISGGDVALSTVLNLSCSCGQIELEVGDPNSKKGTGAASGIDYGGSNASGHEFWIDDNRFAVLDRVKRQVQFYNQSLGDATIPFFSMELTTTPHHLLSDRQMPGRFYISCEGSPSRFLPPSIFVIGETESGFVPIGQMFLPVNPDDIKRSGGHHLDQVGNLIFMGSAEGYGYVFDTRRLELVAKLKTGLGHGHTGFIPYDGKIYAVTINHKDIFTTIIEVDSLTKLGDVAVSHSYPQQEESGRTKLAQGHTSFLRIRDGRPYFYIMVSHESKFLEIDIITRKITRTLDVRCDPKIIDCGIEKLYMVQGTLVSTTPDPMMGGGMANVGMTEDVRNRPNSSRMMICTNCN